MSKVKLILGCLILGICSSCWPSSVSFNDTGSLDECLKLFYMEPLENNAPNAPISYNIELSEAVKAGVQNNTRLLLTEETNNPQVLISGKITNYTVSPIALQEGDNAAKNRLTVSASFDIFYSCPDKKYELEMKMVSTRFADFDSNQDISTIETTLLEEINAQIVQDVINKILSNW